MRVKLPAVNRRKATIHAARALLGLLGLAGGGLLAACPSTATTTSYTPITGITIESSSLVAGYGCGTAPGQVYAYAALLSYTDDAGASKSPVYSGVFDCYANAQFANLPENDGGALSFDVQIFAWDQASFPQVLRCLPSTSSPASAADCPGDSVSTVLSNAGTPNWTTTCTATQELGVSAIAVCAPLTPTAPTHDAGTADAGDGSAVGAPIVVDTHGFVVGDSGTLTCGSGYDTVQATYTVGSQGGEITAVQCPAPLTLTPTIAGAQYTIDVQLLQAGSDVAQATCQATASATTKVTASCAPATE